MKGIKSEFEKSGKSLSVSIRNVLFRLISHVKKDIKASKGFQLGEKDLEDI